MQKNKSSHWYRGLHALHFGGIHGLVALVFVAVLSATMLSPRWVQQASAAITPFSASSFWNNPVPAYTALDPQSASFAAQVSSQVTQYGASFNTTTSSPVYVVDSTTPTVTVEPWDCGVGAMPDLTAQWQSVPIPFYAVPSAGANAQMVIYQPDSATTWEFGHMRNVTGQWQACTGGRVTTSGDGVFQSPYGVSSSGLSTLASQLTPDEIRSGYIDHVIALALPQTNGFTSPATQGSGGNAGAPALGSRLRLDPAVNIDNLGLNAAGRAIARAAQTYGFVVWNTASTVSISGYNPVAQTSRSIADPYAGLGVSSALAQFPWDRLQALPTSTNFATAEPAITAFSVSKSNIGSGQTVTLSWQSANVNRCA